MRTVNDALRDLVAAKIQDFLDKHGLESFEVGVPTPNDVPTVEVKNGYIVVSMVDPSEIAICHGQLPKILVGYMNLLEEAKRLEETFYYNRMSERVTTTWAGLLRWYKAPKAPPGSGNPEIDKMIEEFKSYEDTEVVMFIRGTMVRPEFTEVYASICYTIGLDSNGIDPTQWSIHDQQEFVAEVERYILARIEVNYMDELPAALATVVSILQREVDARETKRRLVFAQDEIERLQHLADEELLQAGIAAVVRMFKELGLTAGPKRIEVLEQLYPKHVAQILDALRVDA